MNNWNNLSMAQRAGVMRLAVENGVYDLDTIRGAYNEFAEGGDTKPDWSYDSWKRQIAEHMGIRPDEDNTYDYEAYFNKYPEEAWKMLKGDPTAHFTDEFKTVYHPTFSSKSIGNDGSIYSGVKNPRTNPQGLVGGSWSPDYKVFTMSPDGYRGPVSMDERKWYLENAEDNGVQLREADGSLPIYDGILWGGVLPNVTVYGMKHSNGGKIHIKPENRGKFTRLKERTGHSATWFKEHCTPAQRNNDTDAQYFGEHYKEIAPMMHLYEGGGKKNIPITTGGAGHIPDNYGRDVKYLFYRNFGPYNTYNIFDLIRNFAKREDYDLRQGAIDDANEHINMVSNSVNAYGQDHANELITQYKIQKNNADIADELLAQYLEIPVEDRHTDVRLKKSKHRNNSYTLPLYNKQWEWIIDDTNDLPIGKNKSSTILSLTGLSEHAIGRGHDSKGEYRSYGDSYDLNPFRGRSALIDIPIINKINDLSFGLGSPVEVYDRIYLDDYYGVKEPTHAVYLPEVTVYGNKKANGGSIHIKPSKRGTFTAAASRHGKSVQEFASQVLSHPENYSLTMRKKANFARNASKWHGLGGNLFGGESQPTQQMSKRYFNTETVFPSYHTVDGGALPEVIVTPTDAQNWLLQKGRYKNNVAPFGDDETRQLAVNYLSQFDNEDAYDYNNRIDRLSDVLQGQLFLKNDVKEGKLKGRAHYKDGKAYVNSMEDIIAEASHPIQHGFGNNFWLDEARNKTYDADVDPRGGTRYAYPDTYEGETHAFFEPILKEWIETGKIGKSSPIINKKKSTQKIVPKSLKEVTDSAASWDKQAIDSRILAMPSQLPPGLSFIYKNIGFPLLDKSRAFGGNLFDGTSQPTQQMNSWVANYNSTPVATQSSYAPNGRYGINGKPYEQWAEEKKAAVAAQEWADNQPQLKPMTMTKKEREIAKVKGDRNAEYERKQELQRKGVEALGILGTFARPSTWAALPFTGIEHFGEGFGTEWANTPIDLAFPLAWRGSGSVVGAARNAVDKGMNAWKYRGVNASNTPRGLLSNAEPLIARGTPEITAENAASITPKVNWDADYWFKTISGRNSYSAEEAADLALNIPEYRAIEQRLFNEGKLVVDVNGNIVVKGSTMSPQEYIMRQSEKFQKMNPEHHYTGVPDSYMQNFENNSINVESWTDRLSPSNVREYAFGNFSKRKDILDNIKYFENLKNQNGSTEDIEEWLNIYRNQLKEFDDNIAQMERSNQGKVYDITYPNDYNDYKMDAAGAHWARIPSDIVADAGIPKKYLRPGTMATDDIVYAANDIDVDPVVVNIDNVMDTYNGTLLNETIIPKQIPKKSVLGSTGWFTLEGPNRNKLYRSLVPPFIGLGTLGTMYGASTDKTSYR